MEMVRKEEAGNFIMEKDAGVDMAQEAGNRSSLCQHGGNWQNRLICGAPLAALAAMGKQGLDGRIQTIFYDPPPHFRDEQVRKTLFRVRDLLHESGSLFIPVDLAAEIALRLALDSVFGADNFVTKITYAMLTTRDEGSLANACGHIFWYAKDRAKLKKRPLFIPLDGHGVADGFKQACAFGKAANIAGMAMRLARRETLLRPGCGKAAILKVRNRSYVPPVGMEWTFSQAGMDRLARAGRIIPDNTSPGYLRYLDDFPFRPLTNLWADTAGCTGVYPASSDEFTLRQVLSRCLLLSSDPGDLALATSPWARWLPLVAEEWGRRWIAIVPEGDELETIQERLSQARYPWYELGNSGEERAIADSMIEADKPEEGVLSALSFKYEQAPRISPIP